MMQKNARQDPALHAAALGAAALIAHQVAGKATRDALFLSHFDVKSLAWMVVAASVVAIALGIAGARLMSSVSPVRVIPRAFLASAVLLVMEWGLSFWSDTLVAVLVYLQIAALGAALISGFWSLLSEYFNPHTARKQFARIVGAGTFGGMIGGLLAERVSAAFGVMSTLLILAALDLICAFLTASLGRNTAAAVHDRRFYSSRAQNPTVTDSRYSGFRVLLDEPYLRHLAMLILLTTVGAGLLDYVFKANAAAAHQNGAELVRFFAIFYTVSGIVTFLVQVALSRRVLETYGLSGAVGSLPFAAALAGFLGLAMPGLASATAGRGGEAVLRSSFFRSGYELFFAAIPRRRRREIKPILDIGFERFGDMLGGLAVSAFLLSGPRVSTQLMLAGAAITGLIGFWISQRLHAGYVNALENNLLNQSIHIEISDIRDSVTRSAVMQTMSKRARIHDSRTITVPRAETPKVVDPIVQRVAALRSQESAAVRQALRETLESAIASHAIALLAWNSVADEAVAALQKIAPSISGQLVDALLDPAQEFAIRRRIPRVLSVSVSQRAFDGLTQALLDNRFEVRFQAGRALAQIQDRVPDIKVDRAVVTEAVLRELTVDKEVWKSRSVIDAGEPEMSSVSSEHVFRILSLILPREPLKIAYRGLHSGDEHLKGMAVEYLESVLPPELRRMMSPLLEAA
jgi:ATP:ADP antiporter, AAA family